MLKKNSKKIFRLASLRIAGQTGQSLIEVMAAGAVVALSALAVGQMVMQGLSLTVSSTDVNDFDSLEKVVRQNVSTEASCRLMIGGPLTYGGPPTANNQVFNGTTTPIMLYQYQGGTIVPFLGDPTLTGANPALSQWKDWKILNLNLKADPGVSLNPAIIRPVVLTITAQRIKPGAFANISTSTVRLSLKTDLAGNIGSCVGVTYGTDVMPTPVCGAGQAQSSDGTRIFCRTVKCFAPYVSSGSLDGYGNLICN